MTNLPDYAFPYPETEQSSWASRGMTLRDYFAAKAISLFSLTASDVQDLIGLGKPAHDRVADFCYNLADAMLKAREK